MRIPKPFLPVTVETDGLSYRARVLGREMTFGANLSLCNLVYQYIRYATVAQYENAFYNRLKFAAVYYLFCFSRFGIVSFI